MNPDGHGEATREGAFALTEAAAAAGRRSAWDGPGGPTESVAPGVTVPSQ